MTFYVEIGIAWRDGGTHLQPKNQQQPTYERLTRFWMWDPVVFPSHRTFPIISNKPSMMWYSSKSEKSGTAVLQQTEFHAHHAVLDSMWVFIGPPKEALGLSLLEDMFWDHSCGEKGSNNCELKIPLNTETAGVSSLSDFKSWVLCKAMIAEKIEKNQMKNLPEFDDSQNSFNMTSQVELCHRANIFKTMKPPNSLACVAKPSYDARVYEAGQIRKYDRRMERRCKSEIKVKEGDTITVLQFNMGTGSLSLENSWGQKGVLQHALFMLHLKGVEPYEPVIFHQGEWPDIFKSSMQCGKIGIC